MSTQLDLLSMVRTTDPASSRDGACRARVNVKRQMILRELSRYPDGLGVWATADDFRDLHGGERSVWSKRLGEAARLGLLEEDRDAVPIRYRLTTEGRAQA